ncbi:MAG TPA: hypothetical protein VHE14_06730 [Solirubrobacteraceae bacterium]|nr:hypothetical protein [Solirubrobacteraceae bacterium]
MRDHTPRRGRGGCPGQTLLLLALGRAPRPFAQALHLARLRKVEQRKQAETGNGGQAGVCAHLHQRGLGRECEDRVHR